MTQEAKNKALTTLNKDFINLPKGWLLYQTDIGEKLIPMRKIQGGVVLAFAAFFLDPIVYYNNGEEKEMLDMLKDKTGSVVVFDHNGNIIGSTEKFFEILNSDAK